MIQATITIDYTQPNSDIIFSAEAVALIEVVSP
jgi:hypothetical protein